MAVAAPPTLDRWYALAVSAGRENSIRTKILDRLERAGLAGPDLEIICPDEEVIVDKGTPERQTKRRMTLSGYMLVRCRNLSAARTVSITGVSGVMGFLGGAEKPQPLGAAEVERILGQQKPGAPRRVSGPIWETEQLVTITDGPLADFSGIISAVNESKGTATVNVEIFGRLTPAEVAFRNLRRT